jgi:hypothetical protein
MKKDDHSGRLFFGLNVFKFYLSGSITAAFAGLMGAVRGLGSSVIMPRCPRGLVSPRTTTASSWHGRIDRALHSGSLRSIPGLWGLGGRLETGAIFSWSSGRLELTGAVAVSC